VVAVTARKRPACCTHRPTAIEDMTISVISLRRLTAHWGGSWWRGQIMGSRWSATNRRLAEEAEDCGGRADILVDREFAGHRGAAVAEPAFIAGPGVDALPMNRYGCFPPAPSVYCR
jgi:transposase InsO family protein